MFNNFKKQSPSLWERIVFFFPFQLVLLHFKRNHVVLFFWLLLFMYVTGTIGAKFGVPYLFLAPEYLGEISALSFYILGFSIGGFVMAFNIYSYILHADEFPFLATLSRPFFKFCLNNIIIPISFCLVVVWNQFNFLVEQEFFEYSKAIVCLLFEAVGVVSFLFITWVYFAFSNKDYYKLSGKNEDEIRKETVVTSVRESTFMKETKWYKRMSRVRKRKVVTYADSLFSIKLARKIKHYDRAMLLKVFRQNHISASYFELFLILTFFSLGVFREISYFNIPAAASVMLLFTIFVMLFSALHSWLKGWTLSVFIISFLGINYLSNNYDFFKFRNYAYGIDYKEKGDYSWEGLKRLNTDEDYYYKSLSKGVKSLNNWKSQLAGEDTKPKLILLNISGGGLRASVFTFGMMRFLDSISNQEFYKHTHLITGASGGMIGAAYYRELKLENRNELPHYQKLENLGKDLLNPLAFSIASSDFLFRYQSFKDGPYSYTKDRGYVFENKLKENLEGAFDDKRINDYYLNELEGLDPTMIFSPCVVKDGRRILISSQPLGYLTYCEDSVYSGTYHSMENIEFQRLLANSNPGNLSMTSALRMNATFPYVLPMVTLPTEPPIEVMDAGIRDNYGLKTSIEYMRNFQDWIKENTSGVILVQIRDKQKYFEAKNPSSGTVISRLFAPLGSFYSNTTKVHDYTNDQLLKGVPSWFDAPFDVVTFYMQQDDEREISMSWHLTNLDKRNISESYTQKDNLRGVEKMLELLNHK